ncbi:hypothetical protein [Nocardia brasiliensis]|uniref:hypothetical protein n=1 Tax=Nocardia brasiliensis TaxID=37326 RepID=UPI002458E301|nr:hypothetical protein [Nocardia brasiliensis]
MGEATLGQGGDRIRFVELDDLRRLGRGVADLACFQRDCVGGQRSRPQGCGQSRDDVVVRQMTVQQKGFDESAGSVLVTACAPGR